MTEAANRGYTVSAEAYKEQETGLREALLDAQYDLMRDKARAVLIVIAGVEGAGKGETVNLLNRWMDPRAIEVSGFLVPTEEEKAHPRMWQFWRALPPRGKIGVFLGAWHTMPILERVAGTMTAAQFTRRVDEILRFEEMLAQEGVLLLKFWFHLSKAQQQKRMKALEDNPDTRWRVTKEDWEKFGLYDKFVEVSEPFLRETSTPHAPWRIIQGFDPNFRSIAVGSQILAAIRDGAQATPAPSNKPVPEASPNVLGALDLGHKLGKKNYAKALEKWQGRLNLLSRDKRFSTAAAVCVFEGNDAAGKGGAIRCVTGALDARFYSTVSIASPSDEEKAHPYLWRFWRHVPRPGFFTIYDRSWYGRVLVERVEGYAAEPDWRRAYAELNDFEEELTRHGTVVNKFWLAIDKDEQMERFQAREDTTFKRFKITEEDWRNRDKWDAYETAVCDMVARTSTAIAPWTLIEANDKKFARIKVLRTLVETIDARLGETGRSSQKSA